ncbi:ras-related protein Rab-32B [Strongylocentrotus purpuratus]|uniref:Ras-related protein Rab n=1 Tax=Strongylocentrotus purpuratus TaxID=7668 RepID=A0A7M7HHL4_STRPU|nr:ras-related protein Rab-32B [Strongylocentrotus purpuratus]|eukprot:XP_011677462.1 PREDICTED: ras-related protein Rab-32B [Strongylocentrotus purpuratus]
MSSAERTVVEHLYKVLVIGEFGVGKTSLIRRYTEGYFSPNYKLTIGVDFALKSLDWDENTRVNLQLWDIAGHERFGHMTRVYYKYAIAAVIVFDLSRPATFDSVLKWSTDVHEKVMLANEQPVPLLLLANKCDLPDTVLDADMLDHFCKENKFIGWFGTSAKDDTNVTDAMSYLVETILQLTSEGQKPQEHISVHQDQDYLTAMKEKRQQDALQSQQKQRKKAEAKCCPI